MSSGSTIAPAASMANWESILSRNSGAHISADVGASPSVDGGFHADGDAVDPSLEKPLKTLREDREVPAEEA